MRLQAQYNLEVTERAYSKKVAVTVPELAAIIHRPLAFAETQTLYADRKRMHTRKNVRRDELIHQKNPLITFHAN
ncbi:MAG: hypothetical protein M2R45_00393 [Verrucomicrobia subdivision 3 bacterium]|nr:hypothetical protein [Limisphaerales bacterium]MCS1412848.1 hypothetical protein [Limisphaerales bacterium]